MERELNLGTSDKSLRVSKIAKKVLQPTMPSIAPARLIEARVLRKGDRYLLELRKDNAANPGLFDHGNIEGGLNDLLEIFPAFAGSISVKPSLHDLPLIKQQIGETGKVSVRLDVTNNRADLIGLEPIDVVDDDEHVSGQGSQPVFEHGARDI